MSRIEPKENYFTYDEIIEKLDMEINSDILQIVLPVAIKYEHYHPRNKENAGTIPHWDIKEVQKILDNKDLFDKVKNEKLNSLISERKKEEARYKKIIEDIDININILIGR